MNWSDLFLAKIVPCLFSHHMTLQIPIPTHHYFHSIFLITDVHKSASGTWKFKLIEQITDISVKVCVCLTANTVLEFFKC